MFLLTLTRRLWGKLWRKLINKLRQLMDLGLVWSFVLASDFRITNISCFWLWNKCLASAKEKENIESLIEFSLKIVLETRWINFGLSHDSQVCGWMNKRPANSDCHRIHLRKLRWSDRQNTVFRRISVKLFFEAF